MMDWIKGAWESLKWMAEELRRRIAQFFASALAFSLIVAMAACKPDPTPTPTPSPTPTPVVECCEIPGDESPGWVGIEPKPEPYNELFVREVRATMDDPCGRPEDETAAEFAQRLLARNICATGPWGEAVLIARPDGDFEEWKVTQSTGCWKTIERAYLNAWRHPGAETCK